MARPAMPPATPPDPSGARRSSAVVHLPDVLDRGDVPAALALARQTAAVARGSHVTCECAAVTRPGMPIVEVIARLALDAHRNGHDFRLEHASPELLELLDLCGLDDVVAGAHEGLGAGSRPAESQSG